MTDQPQPDLPSERSDAAGPRRSSAPPRKGGYSGDDPPTVRSAPAAGLPGSSSSRRVELVAGSAPGIVSLPLPLPRGGERIDIFELEEAIGVGGMGAVFRALDTRLDRLVALKILPPEPAFDTEVVQRFYQEGRAAARLDHENIARVFTIGHDGRFHYIAFEYIEGTTVRQRVERNGPMPVSEAINYTLQIADALVHAAERGVVHRDIKPSNIIVTPHGRAKLVDMGLARRFERGGDDGLTQSGMTLGTFDYISPEQARDPRDVDVRSDLYSLGCTLFHMLTGRPPFPEGTVLQKLIQHQEEPPPDIRALNPAVTADLASILGKLMAKDRDRRYQTPEQLVRDLLTVAGALGLRSVSPEGLVWLSSEAPPAWERHLVWGIPTLVFAVIVSGLVWWGQDPRGPAAGASTEALTKAFSQPGASSKPGVRESGGGASSIPSDELPDDGVVPLAPREIAVESSDELLAAVVSAPPRSVLLLTDDGPYDLGVGRDGRSAPERLLGRDLTIKAAAGVHPVIRLARDQPIGGKARAALLDFAGGVISIDGLEFLLEPGERSEPLAAIRTEDTELTIRRCIFRRPGATAGQGQDASPPRLAAIQIRSSPASRGAGQRPPAVALERCHFDAGQVGVRAVGPAEIQLRDCTLAASEPAVWLENGRASTAVAVDLRLRHVSILAGESPVFRFEGTDPRVWVDDSVIAAAGEGEATLVVTDQPETLSWRGRGNLYARVGTYLLPVDGVLGREAVRDPIRWRETPDGVRETGSVFEAQSVWEDPDPSQVLVQEPQHPARAFRLAATHAGAADVGARQDPFSKPVPAASSRVVANPNTAPEPKNGSSKEPLIPNDAATERRPVAPAANTEVAAPAVESPAPAEPVATARTNDLPEMAVMPPTVTAGHEKEKDRDKPAEPVPAEAPEPVVAERTPALAPAVASHAVLHTVDQLLNALAEPGGQGRPLRVAANADWELSSATVRAAGSWRILAEPGTTRPRLRFLPAPADQKGASAWTAMIELRSGSLQLEGFDIILPRENAPRVGRWAAFAVWPATDLSLTRCTVTIQGEQVTSAAVAVEGGESTVDDALNGVESSASTVRANDSLFRVGGDFVNVGAGRRLVLEMDNAVAITQGALVHGHGVMRGQGAERLSLTLRQVTARMAGGLIRLESTPGEPDLPVADINARYSILATTAKDAPLICVDGQDASETMRDRIVWEGQGVGYHQITTYRRDQSSQVGAVPTNYNRSDWTVAVGSREQMPVHGDLKFSRELSSELPAWTIDRDDLRPAKDSPARSSGSDLDRIPDPPAESS